MDIKYHKKSKLPDKPGVYFFKHKKQILYIGKATSLKDRTKSYFSKDLIETRGPLLVDMVYKADKIDWQETDSVLEALILEAQLIKKHQPYYNTREKDDKSFNYVCITKPARPHDGSGAGGEELPRVIVVRGRNVKHSVFNKIYGPYTSGPQLREAMKIIRRIFPFLDDKSKNYLEFYKQINLVPDLKDRKLYMQNIRNIKLFFSGKKQQILQNLKKEMKDYAKAREFEKAGEIKRQMFALQHINDVALLKQENFSRSSLPRVRGGSHTDKNFPVSFARIESYDIAHMGGKNMVGVMTVVEDGEVAKNEYKKFKIRTQNNANDTGALTEVLERRLAHTEWQYPNLIVVDGGVAQLHAGMSVLKKLGLKIPVVAVLKDEKHKPKDILGASEFTKKYKREILLSNSEAHRFAIAYHKNLRNRNFLI
ncbi:GIY-YIG nuclease family protein [Candidatus Nomurabacteria bacterium]|nr:GIY-YIG nuclease family protein [Candidatus Nomurabacteria bacterium]